MDVIDAVGQLLQGQLGVAYAGQEPQAQSDVPVGGLVILERIGGPMTAYARSDKPWVQATVLAASKKQAADRLRRVRRVLSAPRAWLGDSFIYGAREVLNPEYVTLPADPFYRARVTFEIHVPGLA